MTPVLAAVYDELLARATDPARASRARDACDAYLRRTSSSARAPHSPPEDRMRAAWDDALTAGGLAAELAPTFDDASERALARAIARAHRSTFAIVTEGPHRIVRDLIGGGEFIVLPRDDVARGVLAVDSDEVPLFEARIVAAADGCAIMPGILFHPIAATPLIYSMLHTEDARGLSRAPLCDALMRMHHAFSNLSRVKIAYAYRADALPRPTEPASAKPGDDEC